MPISEKGERTWRKQGFDSASPSCYRIGIGAIMHPEIVLSEEEDDYFVTIIAHAMVGILEVWVKHGEKQTAVELTAIFEKSLETIHYIMEGTSNNSF